MLLATAIRAFLWLPCLLHVTDAQSSADDYISWLTKLSEIPDVDLYPTVTDSLPNIPVEVEIELKNSNRENCDPSQWYCLPYQSTGTTTSTNSTITSTPKIMQCYPPLCLHATCAHSKPNSLSTYLVSDIQYQVGSLDGGYLPFNTSLPECGITMTGSDIIITEATEQCNTISPPQQLYTSLQTTSQNWTLMFTVEQITSLNTSAPTLFLNISGYEPIIDSPSSGIFWTLSFWFNESGYLEASTIRERQSTTFNQDPTLSQTRHITLQFIGDIILVFVDGEVSHRYSTLSRGFQTTSEYIVGFGGSDITGEFTNIKLYNAQASTNEIYSMYSGSPLAPYRTLPECECPRHYSDTLNFIAGDEKQFDCVDPYQSLTSRFVHAIHTDGKFSIFNSLGWVSDYTDEAEITISFSRPMLIYAITSSFPVLLGSNTIPFRPAKMEIKVISTNPAIEGAVSYVSDECLEDYGIDPYNYNAVFGEVNSTLHQTRKKRAVVQTNITPKCFTWKDVFHSITSGFDIPILTPADVGEYLNDAYSGTQLYIHLIGHTSTVNAIRKENWYSIKDLRIYGRPHCGGNPYQLLPGPAVNMSNYYQFTRPGYKFYECTCPSGITGDQCEQCTNSPGVFQYTKRLGVCADCACSDLSSSKQCDPFTGQCSCEGAVDVELAGRQCHWYIDEIDPKHGPKAGGTAITFSGGYFDKGGLVVLINGVIQILSDEGSKRTLNSTPYLGVALPNVTSAVGFTATLTNSTVDLGPQTLYYSFEYRPNPIIEDIYPRATILSGGTNLTVVGEHLDSIAYPEMVVFLTQNAVSIGQLLTRCDVIESDEMVCKVVDLSISIPYLNGDKQAPPVNNVSFPVSSSSTTSSTTGGVARKKRQVTTTADSGDVDTADTLHQLPNVQFFLGFNFDGYTEYTDLRQSTDSNLRGLATLYVYEDPVIEEFKESIGNEVLDYDAGDLIHIEGDRLDYATTLSDYIVIIGVDGVCEVTNLVLNRLSCRPPSSSPDYDPNNSITYKNRDIPHIEVKVGNKRVNVGYVFYKTNIWQTNPAFRNSMIVLMVVVGVALIAVLIYCLVRKFKSKERLGKTLDVDAETSGSHARYVKQDSSKEMEPLVPLFNNEELDAEIQAKVNRCKIPSLRLHIGNQLGKGHFGLVYKSQLTTPAGNLRTVAVKSIKEDKEMSFEDLENFLSEGVLMIDFKHENVLSLVGVVYEPGERPLVVLPYMENGDLCSLVKRDDLEIVMADLLHFAYQIANGMAYLAKERFVHRDLAARNCMVDGSYFVKIADFGMSRDVYSQDYYRMGDMNKPLPMKWMAVESLKEGKYTSKSDVWSFGVTIWELLTRGSTPYPGVNNYYIKEYVSTGKRLDKPEICPPIIYEMMCRCWETDPEDRPAFSEISEFVGRLLNGTTTPSAGSDNDAGYSYTRLTTKDIPDDYLVLEGYADNLERDDYYITPLPSTMAPKVVNGTPKPSPRVPPRTTRSQDTERVYVNTGNRST